MITDYIYNRKIEYSNGLRGDFVKFNQFLHDKVRTGEVKKLSSPITAFWAITHKCNLNCKHCYVSCTKGRTDSDLCLRDAKKIVEILSQNGVMELVLQGGEPFCYDNILEIIEEVKRKEMVLSVLTNGTLLKDDNIKCINNCFDKLDLLQISIDGSQKSNDFIRGEGVFKQVIDNVKKIHIPNVVINCVVTKSNVESLPALCDLLYNETNVKELHFSPLMKIGRGINLDYPNYEKAINIFLHMKRNSKIKISGSIVPDMFFLQNPQEYGINMAYVKLGCCAGRSKIFIDNCGNAYSCDYRANSTFGSFSLFDTDFICGWENSWKKQIEDSYIISQRMHETGRVEKFCPSLYNF